MGSKSVKYMQNREELRQKGHDKELKTPCCERGKNIISERGLSDAVSVSSVYIQNHCHSWLEIQLP
jgi:hypothetical protein